MATFQVQLEDIAGAQDTPDTTAMTDWLTAGARTVLSILPLSKLERTTEEASFTNTTTSEDKRIVEVLRKDASNSNKLMVCRKLTTKSLVRVEDISYMEEATVSDPAYILHDNQIQTFPSSSASNDSLVLFVDSDITVAYSASSIANLPDEAEKAVVLYAARNYLQRLMTDVMNNADIPIAFTAMKEAVDKAEELLDKMEATSESVFGDETTFTTAGSQLTRVKASLDQAGNVINGNEPSGTTDAFGAQANEDTELVASALSIVQAELQKAQTHLAEWTSIGDMRTKEINASLAEAQGYVAEIQARLADDQAKYTWYVQQYQMIDGQYKEEIQILQGSA